MSFFTIPNVFTPGTRARAEEVNENFSTIAQKLTSLDTASVNTSAALEDLTSGTGDFTNLTDEGKTRLKTMFSPFCVISAPLDDYNTPAYASFSGAKLTVSALTTPIKYTDGQNFYTFDDEAEFEVTNGRDGTYNAYLDPDGNLVAYRARCYCADSALDPYESKIAPITSATPSNGTITINTSSNSYYPAWFMFEGTGRPAHPASANAALGATFTLNSVLAPGEYAVVANCRFLSGSITATIGYEDGSTNQVMSVSNPWGQVRAEFSADKNVKSLTITASNQDANNWISGVDLISTKRDDGEVWFSPLTGAQKIFKNASWQDSSLVRVCTFTVENGVITGLSYPPVGPEPLTQHAVSICDMSMPDYSRTFSRSMKVYYTAECPGYLILDYSVVATGAFHITINGYYMGFYQGYTNVDNNHPSQCIIPIPGGARYIFVGENFRAVFVPCKGV